MQLSLADPRGLGFADEAEKASDFIVSGITGLSVCGCVRAYASAFALCVCVCVWPQTHEGQKDARALTRE